MSDFIPAFPLVIDPEFKALIPPLDTDEYSKLESSLLTEGCRDALVVWKHKLAELNGHSPYELVLIDGHHRYELCARHNIPYNVVEREFDSREAVVVWMVKNQLARRNLTDFAKTELALRMKPALETLAREHMSTGGKGDKVLPPLTRTDTVIADSADVSRETVRKVETVLEKAPETIKERARASDLSIDRAYRMTRALEDAAPGTIEAVERFEIDDVETIHVLEDMRRTARDSYEEVTRSGYLQFGEEHEAIPITAGALQLRSGLGIKRVIHAAERRKIAIHEAQTLPDELFNVVYADPPWQYDNAIGNNGPARMHYDDLCLEDIIAFPQTIGLKTAQNAVLFLWVTNPFLVDAFRVIEAWGFRYKTNMVWVKTDFEKPGIGFYVRGRHELLLIATKGSFIPLDTHISPPIGSVIESPLREHSVKPDEVYDIIERLYPDCQYVELFARRERQGWTSHGNQLN